MAGLRPNIYAAVCITMTVAVVALVLRLLSRRMIRMKYWHDDLFSIFACVRINNCCDVIVYVLSRRKTLAVGYSIDVLIWAAYYDLGQYLADPLDSHAEHVRERSRLLLWIEELFYTLSLGFSKFSILALYWRIFQYTSIRTPIQILHVAVMLWLLAKLFLTIFQCIPIRHSWDKSSKGHCPVNVSTFFVATILTHCIIDVIILILPLFPITSMKLSLSKKLAVIAVFHSGIIVVIASIFVIVDSWNYDQNTLQIPRDSAMFSLWGAVEVNMAVFAGCLPALKPIFRKLFPTIKAMSTVLGSTSRLDRQTKPPRAWHWSPRKGRENDPGNDTTSGSPRVEWPAAAADSAPSRPRPHRGTSDDDYEVDLCIAEGQQRYSC